LFWVAPVYGIHAQEPKDDKERLDRAIESLELTVMSFLGMGGGSATEWRREWCEDAAIDLSRGLATIRNLPEGYRALHARAAYLAGKYREAASSYEQLLLTSDEPSERLK